MDAADLTLIGIVIVQFGLLWYRVGRLEGMISRNNRGDKGG